MFVRGSFSEIKRDLSSLINLRVFFFLKKKDFLGGFVSDFDQFGGIEIVGLLLIS